MIQVIKEKIKVAVVFAEDSLKPVWFIFKNEKILIQKICYSWTERDGKWLNYKYTVTDGGTIFEIMFMPEHMVWQLEAIDEGGHYGAA